ncbi:MAG: hypothetical protein RIQ94_3108 [Pseudomonadota bacterium]
MYKSTANHLTYDFKTLANLMAKASPPRSGDYLAGLAAVNFRTRCRTMGAGRITFKAFFN